MIAVIARMRGKCVAQETSVQSSWPGGLQRLANHKGMDRGIYGKNKHEVKKAGN